MPYAIELYLDEESAKRVNLIRHNLKLAGIPIDQGTKPHITLAIYENIEMKVFSNELQMFADKIRSLSVTLSSIGMFVTEKPVIYLAPIVTKGLLTIHSKLHNDFIRYQHEAWDYYLPNKWVPHCTLAMNLHDDMVQRAIEICQELQLPFEVELTSIGILKFPPNKHLIQFKIV